MADAVRTARPSALLVPPDPAPRRTSSERQPGRAPARASGRPRPRDADKRYEIDERMIPRGMDALWAARSVRGAPNPRLTEFIRAGWRPAKASEFPEHSGFDIWGPDSEIRGALGDYVQEVKADGPVIDKEMILLLRPLEMSNEARQEERDAAKSRIEDHLARIRGDSARRIGSKNTRMSRTYGPGNYAPDDGGIEEDE